MHSKNRKTMIIVLVIVFHLGLLTATIPVRGEETPPPETMVEEQQHSVIVKEQERDGTEGKAYYYAKRYQNRKTSSGARYNPRKLTAAHPDLPLGTKVKVVNLVNDRSVMVTINDRCRKHSFEFIDLSQAAARKLGVYGKGMTRVRIIPSEDE
jgi:rare lipoprotein A